MKKSAYFRSIIVLGACAAALFAGAAFADTFPREPVNLIVHASAGGGSDIFARTLAAAFDQNKLLPQPVVVENKPGGSGAIAFGYVASKKGNPYFMVTAVTSFLTTPLSGKSPVGLKDFTPLANFCFDEYMVIARTESRFKSMKDIVDEARANPRKISVGGTQLGSSDSICAYLIEKETGVKLNYIVFNSGGEVNAAILGGHVEIGVANPGEALELMKAGKVKVLGIFSEKRLEVAPAVPTLIEQGINAVYVQNRGLVAPANIPGDARKVLEGALYKYTQTDQFKKYVKDNMLSEAWMGGETFGKWLEGERERYKTLLTEMGVLKK